MLKCEKRKVEMIIGYVFYSADRLYFPGTILTGDRLIFPHYIKLKTFKTVLIVYICCRIFLKISIEMTNYAKKHVYYNAKAVTFIIVPLIFFVILLTWNNSTLKSGRKYRLGIKVFIVDITR